MRFIKQNEQFSPPDGSPAEKSRLQGAVRGYLWALASALFLSTTAVLIRFLTVNYQVPALVIAFWRAGFSASVLLPILAVSDKLRIPDGNRQLIFLIGFGAVMAVFNSYWTLSVARNGAALATMLVYSSVVFTTLTDWMTSQGSLSWVKISAGVVALIGCGIISGAIGSDPQSGGWPGAAVGLLSGIGYAGYCLMGRAAARRGIDPWTALTYTFLFDALFLLLLNLIINRIPARLSGVSGNLFGLGLEYQGWGLLFGLAALPTVLGFGFFNLSLRSLPASIVNLISTSEPVYTALIAFIFLGETLTLQQLVGGLFILAGIVLIRIHELNH